MSLSGVNSVPTPDEPSKSKSQAEPDNNDDKNYSIFDKDKDGVVTVAEQIEAAMLDDTIKEAVDNGFNLDKYIKLRNCEDIETNAPQKYGKNITLQKMVLYANNKVTFMIDVIKGKASKYIQHLKNFPTFVDWQKSTKNS